MKLNIVRLLLILFTVTLTLPAKETKAAKISGLAFGDYYYMFSNHDSEIKAMNGFWFRRIYFTYDQGLAPNMEMRFRLEMAHPGDFKSRKAAVPFVKDAYLKYTFKKMQFILGISQSPTFAVVEKKWGYRAVEKTAADLYKLASSRETGLAVKGKIGRQNPFFYHIMLGNGNAQKGESNKYKKLMMALGSNLTSHLLIEGYVDYEQRSAGERRFSYQGFIAYQQKAITAGLQFMNQVRTRSGLKNRNIAFLSAFVRAGLADNLVAFFRVDKLFNKLEAGPEISYLPVSDQARATLAIAGIDYALAKNVHLMPNAEVVIYDQSNVNTDLMGRVTFFYTFK